MLDEAMEEIIQDPFARSGVSLQARWMEELGGEIAAEDAPGGAVEGGADVVLVASDDFDSLHDREAVCEDSAVLNQGLVSGSVAGDENGRSVAEVEGDYWTVFGMVMAEGGFQLGKWLEEPYGVANKRQGKRTRRELLFAPQDTTQHKMEDCADGEGAKCCHPTIHDYALLLITPVLPFYNTCIERSRKLVKKNKYFLL